MKTVAQFALILGGGLDLCFLFPLIALSIDRYPIPFMVPIVLILFSLGKLFSRRIPQYVPMGVLAFFRLWLGWETIVPIEFVVSTMAFAQGLLWDLWASSMSEPKRQAVFGLVLLSPWWVASHESIGTFWLGGCFLGAALALVGLYTEFLRRLEHA